MFEEHVIPYLEVEKQRLKNNDLEVLKIYGIGRI